MKTLFLMLTTLLMPFGAMAQYWESGTIKTNSFYSYKTGDRQYAKTTAAYLINSEQDGKMEFGSTPLGDVRINGIALYAVDEKDTLLVGSGLESLTVENVAAGRYMVIVSGSPTDKAGQGGNFIVSYVLTPADYVNDPEPNNTWEWAYPIESGNVQHGHLGYKRFGNTDTYDWYKIEVPDEGTVTFTTYASGKLRLGWLGMHVPATDSTVQQRNDKWMNANGKDTTIVYTVPNCKPGTYYVSVQRADGYGSYKMGYTFTANSYGADAADNETWDKAQDMQLDTPTDGRLGYNYYNNTDTYDWFKIEVPEEGKLTFTVKTDPTLNLGWVGMYTQATDSTVQQRNDKWMNANGKDTTLVYEVPDVSIGTYYVRVQRADGYGGYCLTSYFTSHADEADPEPNDTWLEALPLKSGPAITGQLGYTFNKNTDVVDWYRIEVPKEGCVAFNVKTETTLNLGWLGMYTQATDSTVNLRNDKWMNANGKDTTLVYNVPDCKPGVYYVRVERSGGYGTYTMQYIHNPNARQNDPEPNDDWRQASAIESGTVQQGCLGYNHYQNTDTYDWFKIELPDEGKVTFAVTAEPTLNLGWLGMYIPATDSTVQHRNDKWMNASGKDTTLVYDVPNCKPGVYYVRVERSGGYGGYDLDYTFTPNSHAQDNLDNDTWDKATLIENHTIQQGRLGYNYYNNTDTYDWFKIELPEEGKVTFAVTAETTLRLGWLGMHVQATDSTVQQRNDKWMNASGKDTTLVYDVPNCKPGTYYVRVERADGYGGYKIDYTFTPNIFGADPEDNNTWDKASVIEAGSTQQGRLGYNYYNNTDADDWYKIDVPYVGDVTLSVSAETTLNLGWLGLYTQPTDSTIRQRTDKWVNASGKDTTIVLKVSGVGAGTYYIRQNRADGYGGYTLKYDYERNPYDRDNLQNNDFATRYTLEEGKTVSTTLGYTYLNQNNTDWYDLGLMHGRQIDVTVAPDTTHTLIIGVPALYIYKGDKEDGTPDLQKVAESRIERSQGTISYVDQNTADRHYVFYVPNYSGSSYGGYTITLGSSRQEGEVQLDGTNVSVMTEGRNTVRKGVPCENPITITNTSATKSGKFLVTVAATDNIDIIGFRMPGNRGYDYLPLDSVTILDGADCQHTVAFLVPSLDPWESYTFTMVSEGKGDIAYSRTYRTLRSGSNSFVVNSSTYAVVAVMGNAAGADKHINVDDYIVHRIGDVYDLTGEQRLKLSQLISQLEAEKKDTGKAAFSVLTLLKRASYLCGMDLLDASCPIAGSLRQRISQWVNGQCSMADDILDIIDGKAAITDVVASWDPNEMIGPAGVGEEHYIGETQTVNYRILFENKAEAGDAAYRVRISDELDESVFDISTVRFGETSHDGVGYNWQMTRDGNRLSWDIQGIELPPNVNAPEGEGYVSFSVNLRPGLADGTKITNKATIIFDKNYPIETNEYTNTLDLAAPVTEMLGATMTEGDSVIVDCQSGDGGAGVAHFLLFAAKGSSGFEYQGQYFATPMTCPVAGDGSDYSFYVLAVDAVGNTEQFVPEAIITAIENSAPLLEEGQGEASQKWYDLHGRRVSSPFRGMRGDIPIYIHNGKKILVK